ncbi:MAG: DUF3575 domain-containing protein [Paramuribaculum sp.]|nr:DUF3575 domain-containing protein [Paramuribaculum sp.]
MLLGAISPAWAQNAKEGEFYSPTPQACPDDTISVTIESDGGRMDTVGIRIYFHQSKVNLLPKYQRNAERLDSFLVELQRIKNDPSLKVRAIRIMGGASPEGTTRFNKWLSEQRAARITEYMVKNSPVELDPSVISAEYPGVDWCGLKRIVLADPDVPDRDEVLRIIDTPGTPDDRMPRLKKLHWAIPWMYLYNKYYPSLRASQVQIIYEHPRPPLPRLMIGPQRFNYVPTIIAPPMPYYHILTDRPFYMTVSTNMLYDLFLIPNVGIDFYMGKRWSAEINWNYAWWKSDRIHWYWRYYGGDLTIKKWFGKKAQGKPFSGHHIGPYFQMLTYDFELGGKGYQARRWTHAAGIAYGYSMPITSRLNLDFTIGLGYSWGQFYKYVPIDNHYVWKATKRRKMISPTRLEVSLVWLLGHGNVNTEEDLEK